MKFPPHEQVAALGTLVAQLSIESQWLLSYIANYLTFINQYVDKNLMTFDNLAIVFAPSIFRKKVCAPPSLSLSEKNKPKIISLSLSLPFVLFFTRM